MIKLPENLELVAKRNRLQRLSPKIHKIVHESGRGLKERWRKTVQKARGAK